MARSGAGNAAAHLGRAAVAIGSGTDVAREASDITLMTGDLRSAADAPALSRRTLRTIKGKLFWAFAKSAESDDRGRGMACSSLFVVENSLRLRDFSPRRDGS